MKQSSAKYRYGHAVQAVHRTRALWMQTRTSDAAWRLCQRASDCASSGTARRMVGSKVRASGKEVLMRRTFEFTRVRRAWHAGKNG